MNRLLLAAVLLAAAAAAAAAPQTDKAGCTDHPLFPSRMPNYYIETCKVEEFGFYEFFTLRPPRRRAEGKHTFITYTVTTRASEASPLAVVRNYEAALRKIGATDLTTDPKATWWVNARVTKNGHEAWAEAQKGNGKIWIHVVEVQAMTQHVVADAAALGADIKSTGHVAVYGIHFDTNKSVVKPDSKPALDEIAKLLKTDASLKLKVVGHTDMVGALDANMTLSQARADAVVQALVSQYAVPAAKLKGYGVGPLAPVASNDNEEGRAKNRRVELVKD
jgi:outer membrane protein OmpA-like peptidoglycan-associated protein